MFQHLKRFFYDVPNKLEDIWIAPLSAGGVIARNFAPKPFRHRVSSSTMSGYRHNLLRREIRNLYLYQGTLLATLSFFALALFCMALGLGPEEKILRQSAPAILWVLAILTTLFSVPPLLKQEAHEGLLDEILLHPLLPAFHILSKIEAICLLLGLPLILLGVLMSLLFAMPLEDVMMVSSTLLVGFPGLSALGILGGILTLHARGGGLLIALLILPFTLPLLLFSLSVMEMTRLGLDSFAPFCLLISTSLFLVILSIGIGSWALRCSGEG